jgi:hypothetical protein
MAVDVGLEPQNRVHFGVNWVDGPSPVTRLVSVDLGGFASPVPIAEDLGYEAVEYKNYYVLRHGMYVAPGIRVPHPQPRTVAYDFFGRVGAGVVWTANLSPDVSGFDTSNYQVTPAPAGLVGADALVRVGRFGARVSGKAWMYQVVRASPEDQFFMVRAQASVEGLFQW